MRRKRRRQRQWNTVKEKKKLNRPTYQQFNIRENKESNNYKRQVFFFQNFHLVLSRCFVFYTLVYSSEPPRLHMYIYGLECNWAHFVDVYEHFIRCIFFFFSSLFSFFILKLCEMKKNIVSVYFFFFCCHYTYTMYCSFAFLPNKNVSNT